MYIYNIKVIVKWSYNNSIQEADCCNNPDEYNVAARNFTQALAKVEKLALSKSRIWKEKAEDNDEMKEYTHIPEYIVDVISSERKEEIDG